ncbi:MAG: metal-dependent hydrolase [Chloroflexota bacterium]
MTTVGHALTGIAIGILCLPPNRSKRWKWRYFAGLVVLADVPDLPLPYWGHSRYSVSHSLFVNLGIMLLVLLGVWLLPLAPSIKQARVLFAGSAAWLSHFLLDSFYNHGDGVAIYWPISSGHLTLPIPWFSVLPKPPLTLQHLQIVGIEFLVYGLVVGLAFLIRQQVQMHTSLSAP